MARYSRHQRWRRSNSSRISTCSGMITKEKDRKNQSIHSEVVNSWWFFFNIFYLCVLLSFETNINILCRFPISIFSFIYIRSYKYTCLRDSVTYTGTSETSSPSSSWFYIAASRDILQDSWNICLCWAMSWLKFFQCMGALNYNIPIPICGKLRLPTDLQWPIYWHLPA